MATATAQSATAEATRRDYLWAGEIVHEMPPNEPHSQVLYLIAYYLSAIFPRDAFTIRTEQPLALRPGYEPQPDLMVLKGSAVDRIEHRPTPDEVVLLVEIADSSLTNDLIKKAPEYAARGIQPYWVVDVRGRRVFTFANPDLAAGRYSTDAEYNRGDRIPVGDTAMIAVDDLFRGLS